MKILHVTKKHRQELDNIEYEVEIDEEYRNNEFDNEWRYNYPSWMIFKKRTMAQQVLRYLTEQLRSKQR